MSMSTPTRKLIGKGVLMAKNSSPSRAPKTDAQIQTTWKSAKHAEKPSKKTHPHRHSRHTVRILSMNCARRDIKEKLGTTSEGFSTIQQVRIGETCM